MLEHPDDAIYENNVKKQYEALGRFVEAFELLVRELRIGCMQLIVLKEEADDDLLQIVFHHQALTAKPMFEIFRALIVQTVSSHRHRRHKHLDLYQGLLSHISKRFVDLTNTRNNLLHGTWLMGGRSSQDPNAEKFHLSKFTASKQGLKRLEDLPRTATDLSGLTTECTELMAWIENLNLTLDQVRNVEIPTLFRFQDPHWNLIEDRAIHGSIRSFRP